MIQLNVGALRGLQRARLDDFVERTEAWVSRRWPERRPVGDFVRRAVEEANSFGLHSEECVARYIMWRGDLGDLLFEHPGMDGTRELLTDETWTERDKVDAIDLALYGRSFLPAGRDPAWQEQQVDDFLTRLDTAVGGRPTGYSHPISDYVTSERGVALVLDQSVNRPGHVNGDMGRALNDFYADHPEAPRDPTRWTATQRAQYEPEILQRYVPYRADHGLPMTDNDQRAQAINGNSNVSAQPGSFERPVRP